MPLTDDVVVRRKQSPRALQLEQRRAEILRAAARLFAERGYNGTSLREVAAEVGLSPAGLIHHFPDKVSLLEAVLDDRLGDAERSLGRRDEDGETLLRGLVDLARRDVADPADLRLFCVLSAEAAAPGHPAHGWFARWFGLVRDRLTAAFDDLEAKGRYRGRPLTPAEAALHVSALRDGVNLQWLMAPESVDLVAAVQAGYGRFVDVRW